MKKPNSETNNKIQALEVAKMIGCSGAHKTSEGIWMPCESPETLNEISTVAESSRWQTVVPKPGKETIKKKSLDEWFEGYGSNGASQKSNPEDVRRFTRMKKGRKFKKRRNLPMHMGAIHLDGVGLVSGGGIAMKSKAKYSNRGPEYMRETDPDVFLDPQSARFRSRQLGCIGISRRISKNGRAVWMPCTNMTDYSRLSGATSLGRRHQRNSSRSMIRTVLRQELSKLKRKKSIADEILNK